MHKIILFGYLLATSLTLPAQSQRFYVDAQASGLNNGQSWADAFNNLHDALVVAQAGDEVWVAEGIYYPTAGGDRSARFEPLSGLRLYGGFNKSELVPEQRNPELHPSILDGDIGIPGDSLDNSWNLLYWYRPDSNSRLDGFILRNAVANKPDVGFTDPGAAGAALYVMAFNAEAYPIIYGCRFHNNSAAGDGGAVFVNGGGSGSAAPQFLHCRFTYNRSERNGGAIHRFGGSWRNTLPDIGNCRFEYNIARRKGSAVLFSDSPRTDTFEIFNCMVGYNKNLGFNTSNPYGTVEVDIPRFNGESMLWIKETNFNHNSPFSNASTINSIDLNINPGNVFLLLDSVQFDNELLPGFVGSLIGYCRFDVNNVDITNCQQDGRFEGHGTVGTISSLLPDKFNTLKSDKKFFLENIFSKKVYMDDFISPFLRLSYDIADTVVAKNIINYNLQPSNNEFFRVSAANGASIRIDNLSLSNGYPYINTYNAKIYLNNAAVKFTSNFSPFYDFGSNGTLYLNNCIFSWPQPTSGNVLIQNNVQWNTDPLFVNPAAGDFRLQACSPAINAGDNTWAPGATDIYGQPRIQFGTVDIGAVEMGELFFPNGYFPWWSQQQACGGLPVGRIDITSLDDCAPATYSWSHDPNLNSPVATQLLPGQYTVSVTDARGRTTLISYPIMAVPSPQVSAQADPVICGQTSGGALYATSPDDVTFRWSGFLPAPVQQGVAAGTYTVTATDDNYCTATATAQVATVGNLDINLNQQDASCFGANNGSAAVQPANGKAPFNWMWNDGFTQPARTMLPPGDYTVQVGDAFNCTAVAAISILQPDPIVVQDTVYQPSGPAIPDGSIILTDVGGGTPPFTYVWSNGGNGPVLSNLLPGAYTLTLTDANACSSTKTWQLGTIATAGPTQADIRPTVFPNPAGASIRLKGLPPGSGRLIICDAGGKLVMEQTILSSGGDQASQAVSVANLSAGAYRWQVILPDKVYSGFFIKE